MQNTASCIYCDLGRKKVLGVRLSTPRESAQWRTWRAGLHDALKATTGSSALRRGGLILLPS